MEFLLLIGAAGLIIYLSSAKKFINKLQIKFIDIFIDQKKIVNSNFSKLFFELKIKIINPTDFQIDVLNVNTKIYYDDKFLGNAEIDNKYTIKKFSDIIINIPGYVDTSNSIILLSNMFINNNTVLNFVGSIGLNIGNVNFNVNKNL
jgi:LEA14-like dessication related protein